VKLWFLFSIRDAVSDLALHFLAKMKIMVIKDVEREDIEFICKVSRLLVNSTI
jgi:chaperonin GroEL (HSP60 family)